MTEVTSMAWKEPEKKWPHQGVLDLTEMAESGVLMAANEAFFWPLGLALTWVYDPDTGQHSNLYLTEWRYEDGHHEAIELAADDPVGIERRFRFGAWLESRIASMPLGERPRPGDKTMVVEET